MARGPLVVTTHTTMNSAPLRQIQGMVNLQLLIGIPAGSPNRLIATDPSNAALLFIHEFGSPARRIPARPSLHPGVQKELPQIVQVLRRAAAATLPDGRPNLVLLRASMQACGLIAVNSVRQEIHNKIPPDIADITKRNRLTSKNAYKNASFAKKQSMMATWMAGDFTPLLDTGQLIRAITYVIRRRR
jgi:hypothetical protein